MIVIDKEFKDLIPPLSQEEFEQLEQNCLKEGIRDALVVWPQEDGSDILLDGHNRWEIFNKHPNRLGLNYKRIKFEDRDQAKTWIIANQLGRRNLPKYEKARLALELKPAIAEKAKIQQGTRTDLSQKSVKSHDTQKELANIAGVSHDTIHKVEVIENSGNEYVKSQARSGELSVNKAYSMVTHKTPQQSKKEFIQEAKDQHEEFKNNTVVTMQDIADDKENRKILARELYLKIHSLGKQINDFILDECIDESDFGLLKEFYSDKCREYLIPSLRSWLSTLLKLIEEVS